MNLDALLSAYPLIALVGWLAWTLRGDPPQQAQLDDREPPAARERNTVLVPVTSDGVAFVPVEGSVMVHRVEHVAPDLDFDTARAAGVVPVEREWLPERPRSPLGASIRRDGLERRSLTAARVRAGGGTFLLEVLGRDADYDYVPFHTRAGADAALALLDRHAILQRPRDARGRPVPSSPEDFEEARRRLEDSIRWMALDGWDARAG